MTKRIYPLIVILALLILNFSALAIAASSPSAAEWEKTVAAAKREGKVVIIGPQGTETKDALVEGPLFNDRLIQGLLRAEREKETLAVLFIDLDDFKLSIGIEN